MSSSGIPEIPMPPPSNEDPLPLAVWNVETQDGTKHVIMAGGFNVVNEYVVFFGPSGEPIDMFLHPKRVTPDRTNMGNA